ncbi:MAG: thioredoxin family protein [Pseudomonadota bacterium]
MFKRLALIACLSAGPVAADAIPAGFNDDGIPWRDLASGLEAAKTENKRIFLVVHTTWCGVCTAYKKRFFSPLVEEATEDVIFVLIDQDAEPDAAALYAPDGFYIPRTMILDPDGQIIEALQPLDPPYRYYVKAGNWYTFTRLLLHARQPS